MRLADPRKHACQRPRHAHAFSVCAVITVSRRQRCVQQRQRALYMPLFFVALAALGAHGHARGAALAPLCLGQSESLPSPRQFPPRACSLRTFTMGMFFTKVRIRHRMSCGTQRRFSAPSAVGGGRAPVVALPRTLCPLVPTMPPTTLAVLPSSPPHSCLTG